MSLYVEKLKNEVISKASLSDEIIIISGYFSADMLSIVAKLNKKTMFYYGMFNRSGITPLQYKSLEIIETQNPKFSASIVFDYHVHSKCYIFKKDGSIFAAMVGSANVSVSGLDCGKNSEILVDVDPECFPSVELYANEVSGASVKYNDTIIVPSVKSISSARKITTPKGRVYSGSPFVDNIPLFVYSGKKKEVLQSSGLNWGLQKGHTTRASDFAEAYIPIKAYDIDTYPLIFPPLGMVGSGTGGKSTRRLGPVIVTWDDGTVMQMLFQGNGPTRPTPSKRLPGTPYKEYPKQLTTNEGGVALGRYLRNRLGVSGRALITYDDLKRYGRDFITLTLIDTDNYEADFHV